MPRALGGEFISFENTQRLTYPSEASNICFCRKTSILQWLLQNKKDRFCVRIFVQTDTPDIDISRNGREEFGRRVSLVH